MSDLTLPPVNGIKAVVDLLADLEIDPLHLHCDGRKPTDPRHIVRLWLRYRTDFEAVVTILGLKSVERPNRVHGQREWHAERADAGMRLLVACVSFAHHDDWEPMGRYDRRVIVSVLPAMAVGASVDPPAADETPDAKGYLPLGQLAQDPALTRRAGNDEPNPDPHPPHDGRATEEQA